MTWFDLSLKEALHFLKHQRPKANPNPGFKRQLRDFHGNDLRRQLREDMMASNEWKALMKNDIEEMLNALRRPRNHKDGPSARVRERNEAMHNSLIETIESRHADHVDASADK